MAEKIDDIIMNTLRSLRGPSTLTNIVKDIADHHQVEASHIKEPVKMVLEKGVEFGFIQKDGTRYRADAITYEGAKSGPHVRNSNPPDECNYQRKRSYSRRRRSRSRTQRRSTSRSRRKSPSGRRRY